MRLKKYFAVFLCALLLTGCRVDPSEGNASNVSAEGGNVVEEAEETTEELPFSLAIYSDLTIHPVFAESRVNHMLAPLLYEPLFELDEAFMPHGVLCRSYTADETFTQWEFTLRSGVTFSDGTPLTGQVVADALNLAKQSGSIYSGRMTAMTSITGDETTVRILLSSPNSALPALLDIPIALGDGTMPLGTGPYALTGEGNSLLLSARTNWWQEGAALPLDAVPLTSIHQTDDLISGFDAGDVTMLDVDLTGTNALGYSGNYEVLDYATPTLIYLGINTAVRGAGQDGQFRTALSLALDRENIVDSLCAGHAIAATLPIHPASSFYHPSAAKKLEYHAESAREIVSGLTLPTAPLTLLVNAENTTKTAIAQRIADQLSAIGVQVEVSRLAWEDYTVALSRGEFDLYLGEVILTADFNLSALLSSGGALNYGRWSSGETNALIAAFAAADETQRSAAANELSVHLAEQCPIVPLLFKNASVLTQWGRASVMSPVWGNVFYDFENWVLS